MPDQPEEIKDDKSKTRENFLGKSRIYAEFNSSELDLESMRRLLDACDIIRIRNTMHDVKAIRPFYSMLNTLYYSFLRTFLSEAERAESDRVIKEIGKQVYLKPTLINPKIYSMLNDFHAFLIKARQMQGLGIAFRRDMSLKRRIEKGLNIDRSKRK